jgi:orotate phosphoribosyltransferase
MVEVLSLFDKTGALLDGHFELTSGLHSPKYLQCALILQFPDYGAILGKELSERFRREGVDVVIGPALGGIIIAYEVAKNLKARAIFAEREEGKMTLRRGFKIRKGERVLVIEDVITTGGSVLEVINLAREAGGEVVGVGAVVDRSGGRIKLGVRLESLIGLEIATYHPGECPMCREGVPLVKPGGRK